MNRLSRNSRVAVLALPAMLLMACANPQDAEVNQVSMQGDGFDRHLARNYRDHHNYESYEMYDYWDGVAYSDKALAATAGRSVSPDDLSGRDLGDDKLAELQAARGELMQAFSAGAAQKSPVTAARAQSQFDCWVEQEEEGWQPKHIAACKDGFWSAMQATQVAMAPAPAPQAAQRPAPAAEQPSSYRVFFDWDKSEITADARQLIGQVIERNRGSGLDIHLIGNTDSSGSDAYNMRLSQRRAAAIRDYLIANGVARNAISSEAHGERNQLVPTRDNVREVQNRRVSIELSTSSTARAGS